MFRERKKLILGLCLIRQSKQTSTIGFRVSVINLSYCRLTNASKMVYNLSKAKY